MKYISFQMIPDFECSLSSIQIPTVSCWYTNPTLSLGQSRLELLKNLEGIGRLPQRIIIESIEISIKPVKALFSNIHLDANPVIWVLWSWDKVF